MKKIPKATWYVFLFSLILLIIILVNIDKSTNSTEKEKLLIEKTLNNVFGWAKTKNIDLFLNSISSDSIFRSITPYNRVVYYPEGIEQNKKFWLDERFKAISHEICDLEINLSQSGSYAWFFCIIDDYNKWEDQEINWEKVRWTGILEKRNNEWKVVQQHFSFTNK